MENSIKKHDDLGVPPHHLRTPRYEHRQFKFIETQEPHSIFWGVGHAPINILVVTPKFKQHLSGKSYENGFKNKWKPMENQWIHSSSHTRPMNPIEKTMDSKHVYESC